MNDERDIFLSGKTLSNLFPSTILSLSLPCQVEINYFNLRGKTFAFSSLKSSSACKNRDADDDDAEKVEGIELSRSGKERERL